MTWWDGMWLVARRSLVENLHSRTFKVVTGLLLLLSIGGVVVPQLISQDETTYTLGHCRRGAGAAQVRPRGSRTGCGLHRQVRDPGQRRGRAGGRA